MFSSNPEQSKGTVALRGRAVPERKLAGAKCGCDSCTDQVLNTLADGHSCGSRIDWAIGNMGLSESEACGLIGGEEYPSKCGGCNPSSCPAPSSHCNCNRCTDAVWNTIADGHSCGDRISWLEQTDVATLLSLGIADGPFDQASACRAVSEQFPGTCTCDCSSTPVEAPPASPPTPMLTGEPIDNTMCGCSSCTDQVLNSVAEGHTCRNRIEWIKANQGLSEADSCQIVADEFPSICGKCDVDRCGSSPPPPAPVSNIGSIKAMSYNTEYSGYADGRLPDFASKIREVDPDVVGIQECQDANALASASGYDVVRQTGPQNYIFYKPGRLQVLESGFMSIPRDNYSERTITWGKFRVVSGDGIGNEFWFFNTHLPHRHNEASDPNTHARIGRLLVAKRAELNAANTPTIVVGDCNPFASDGAPEGSFESNLASGGIPKVYQARGNTGGHAGLDKIFASAGHWTASNAADRGTGRSDHPAISVDLLTKDA